MPTGPADEFSSAANYFSDAQAWLLDLWLEAEDLLDSLPADFHSGSVGDLYEAMANAEEFIDAEIPEMKTSEEEIQEQAEALREQAETLEGLCWELEDRIYVVQMVLDGQTWAYVSSTEIIMARAELGSRYHYTIYGIDPETGEQRLISEFNIPVSLTWDDEKWRIEPMFVAAREQMPLRAMFSRDYQYIAASRTSFDTEERRAGFFLSDLRYMDISEVTGAVGGDFDDPVHQLALGFTDDGRFIFADTPDGSLNFFYYDTSVWDFFQTETSVFAEAVQNSLQPFEDADAFLIQGDRWSWWGKNWQLTDRIDDTHLLINYPEESAELLFGGDRIDRWGCRILDIETQATTSFIPGESRSNWSGVVSPNGESVAFLSAPVNGTGSASLYITSLEGGEPVKLCEDIPSGRGSTGYTLTRPDSSSTVYFLLEWRKRIQ